MVFSTIIFLLRFLPVTLALYYLAPPKLKNTVLFLCSLEAAQEQDGIFELRRREIVERQRDGQKAQQEDDGAEDHGVRLLSGSPRQRGAD